MDTDDRIERAKLFYEQMAFTGDSSGLATAERELDGVEAALALARGRVLHGRFLETQREDQEELALFERAAQLFRMLGDEAGEGDSLLWVGIFHQFVRHDNAAAGPALERSRELVERTGDGLMLSYVLRHLGIAQHAAGRLDAARDLLEESTRLRREAGMLPGVAANLVGLAYIALAQGRHDDAVAIVAEAGDLATASGAHGITRQVDEARTAL